MSAAYTLIGKTCRAIQCYIRDANLSGLPSENVRAHKESESKSFPYVLVRHTKSAMMRGNPGKWIVDVEVAVATQMTVHPEDTETNAIERSDELAGAVFDLFFSHIVAGDASNLADAITNSAHAAAASAPGDDPASILAAKAFASLAEFTCDAVEFPGGVDIQETPEGNAYVDVLPLTLHVRAYPAAT